MENRIKDQQTNLFGTRMSASSFAQNSLRFLMSTFAKVLVTQLRATALKGTKRAKSYCGTIRTKLLKIGAVVLRNTRPFIESSLQEPFHPDSGKAAHDDILSQLCAVPGTSKNGVRGNCAQLSEFMTIEDEKSNE